MGLSITGKKPFATKYVGVGREEVFENDIGETIHAFFDEKGNLTGCYKEFHEMTYEDIYGEDEYCPHCHVQMIYSDGTFECPTCNYIIDWEDSANGEGYHTLEASYRNDYGWLGVFNDDDAVPDYRECTYDDDQYDPDDMDYDDDDEDW